MLHRDDITLERKGKPMRILGKKILGMLLIMMIISWTNVVLALDETALNNQKENNNQKIQETEAEKEKVQELKSETVKQVEELDSQIDEYQSQISSLDGQIAEANTKIQETTAKLEQAQKDYENQQKMLEERVVALYEAGETTYLDVLLSSESVTDFISSYYVISEIAQCDVDLLNEIDFKKKEIETTKQELEASKNQLTSARTNKKLVASQLEATKTEKQNKVAQLSEQEQQLQAQIDEIKKDNVSIDQQIQSYKAELKRKMEEELRRRKQQEEEEARRRKSEANAGGGTTSSGSSGTTTGTSSSGFIHPVPSAYATVTTKWYYSNGSVHGAVDYGSGGIAGQPVYAVADGIVAQTAALTTSYGNYIIIMHYNGLYTLYAHGQQGSITVSKGQPVKQGQQIMKVGSSGNSTGPHLHFEVRTDPGLYSNRKNPLNYLP